MPAPVLAIGCLVMISATLSAAASATPRGSAPEKMDRGEYLTRAGDCTSCHTAIGGKPFAGGRAIETPFGTIYTPNITPDKATGIGSWTESDFNNALRNGKDDEGAHLYPAMPYPSYTKVTRADVDAIRTYLATVAPVQQQNKPPQLRWPMGWRGVMAAWNLLYFDAGEYQTDPAQSTHWNRGAYLVEGLGHCGGCHTPRNALGASKSAESLQGGKTAEQWYAPGLGDNLRDGVGNWSEAEVIEYLKTGANDKSASAGPMTEVVMNSTQYLSDSDLSAISVYLKRRPNAQEKSSPAVAPLRRPALARGQALYLDNCTACHMPDGRGIANVFPPLTGSAAIQADDPGTVLHVVLDGARMAATKSKPTGLMMPGFGWKFTDAEVADVVNYIRHAWGNRAPDVDLKAVAAVRRAVEAPDRPAGTRNMHPDARWRPELWDVRDDASQAPRTPDTQ